MKLHDEDYKPEIYNTCKAFTSPKWQNSRLYNIESQNKRIYTPNTASTKEPLLQYQEEKYKIYKPNGKKSNEVTNWEGPKHDMPT